MNGYSRLALIGAVVAIGAFATAAVLFVSSDDAMQRLALLFGLFGIAVPAIIGVLKADAAAEQTSRSSNIAQALDGAFDQRVQDAVQRGNAATEAGTPPPAAAHPGNHGTIG